MHGLLQKTPFCWNLFRYLVRTSGPSSPIFSRGARASTVARDGTTTSTPAPRNVIGPMLKTGSCFYCKRKKGRRGREAARMMPLARMSRLSGPKLRSPFQEELIMQSRITGTALWKITRRCTAWFARQMKATCRKNCGLGRSTVRLIRSRECSKRENRLSKSCWRSWAT